MAVPISLGFTCACYDRNSILDFTHSFSPFFLQKKSKTIMVCSAFKNERTKPGISLFIYRTQIFYFVFQYGIAVIQIDDA